ncbi:MAG: hypothetical protein UX12_C0030G0004 [Candidatus Collierbacteria bacterium GW2011_GWC1_45_47]|uniref:Uncharacterized protein n=5 Tax=Candidatus Collieribacteriota TaxID=1752725 RepID=A0A0G1HK05_9BACT|nr:MAG: hypothetical protein UW23_C0025G0014 [Candidatus Collierbacteria bacterium GW2011_GWA1_44_12]KKT39372.1 MAG: hypothetical protein UW26_C0003G0018 [Candidatus Collierbacteria bacterium GW2011_GWF1_44_12]KKT46908.1 MAG: hypothetical protein UW35_C0006G0013 [Candidatus Collierbacteria bacterium GW2011_GWF2_44_15]KKT99267.1 MAG: hypothetical protein UW99_C0007G0005 [Candidatus Collierbacteria bacterium GW2011_GWC2_45_15]KKU08843.1 MAG: hypothetical protein UX12_C0030G0004 [Candidatus Collie
MEIKPYGRGELKKPPSFWKILGPSFILLGLGLGSGEVILWPYLSANYGLGLMWGAVVGITFQFFINMEIGRYTLVTGESVFVGWTRLIGKLAPIWFIFSTLLPWMWPGIVASAARIMGSGLGIEETTGLAVGMILLSGIALTLGPVLYQTQETMQKWLIILGVPFVLGLSWYLASGTDWSQLFMGVVGKGEGFWFLPAGVPIASFLAAVAFSGAGGNLNLGTSQNVKEKGYAMGAGMGRITSLLTGKREEVELTGKFFEGTEENKKTFWKWWRLVNLEHGVVFWLTGLVTMLSLALLAYATVHNKLAGVTGVDFVISEGGVIGSRLGVFWGRAFLVIAGLMLFATQLSVLATTGKIMAENWALIKYSQFKSENLSKYFYLFLWILIAMQIGVLMFGFREPLQLVTLSAVLNAGSMFIFSIMIMWLNKKKLPIIFRANLLRRMMMVLAIAFLGGFSIWTIIQFLGRV